MVFLLKSLQLWGYGNFLEMLELPNFGHMNTSTI